MLIQIGSRREVHAEDDVVGPLLDCHARIRAFAAIAGRIAAGEGPLAGVAEAAGRVERYFRVALPLHVADEEISLRPRLLASPTAPEIAAALDAMTDEHGAIEALLGSLLPRWAAIASGSPDPAALSPALARDTADLQRRFEAHLDAEERALFPAVRDHLGAAALAIRGEMAARRAGSGGT